MSINVSAAGVMKVSRDKVIVDPVHVGTASPVASLCKTFKGCLRSGGVDLSRMRRIVLANMNSTCVSRQVCNLPASGDRRFITSKLNTQCRDGLRHVVIMDVNAKASLMGYSNGRVGRVNNVNVNKKALTNLDQVVLGASSVGRVMGLTGGNSMSGVGLLVKSVDTGPLPKLPVGTATSLFDGTGTGTSHRSVTVKLV